MSLWEESSKSAMRPDNYWEFDFVHNMKAYLVCRHKYIDVYYHMFSTYVLRFYTILDTHSQLSLQEYILDQPKVKRRDLSWRTLDKLCFSNRKTKRLKSHDQKLSNQLTRAIVRPQIFLQCSTILNRFDANRMAWECVENESWLELEVVKKYRHTKVSY